VSYKHIDEVGLGLLQIQTEYSKHSKVYVHRTLLGLLDI